MEYRKQREVIKTRNLAELIEKIMILTGPVSLKMAGFFPTTYKTYVNLVSEMRRSGRPLRQNKRMGEKFIVFTKEAIRMENELLLKTALGGYIENGKWNAIFERASRGYQLAYLSGAEVEGLRLVYAPDNFGITRENEKVAMQVVGFLPPEEGEGDPIEYDVMKRIKNHEYEFGVYITKSDLIEWSKRMSESTDLDARKQVRNAGATGYLLSPNGELWAIYFTGDIKGFRAKKPIETRVRGVIEPLTGKELKGLFITRNEKDKELLLKKRRTWKDNKINPALIHPENVYDDFKVFTVKEASEIQKITGSFKRDKETLSNKRR
jgi:hypothetical protein